jgi:hypothetical protein
VLIDEKNHDELGIMMEANVVSPAMTSEKSYSRRATFLMWLRKTHGWIGLWGATLGLLFGVTGFVLNLKTAVKSQNSPRGQS